MRRNLYHDIAIYCSKIHDMRQKEGEKEGKNPAARPPFSEIRRDLLPPASTSGNVRRADKSHVCRIFNRKAVMSKI